MMIAVGESDPVKVSKQLVDAAVWRAEYLAHLTGTALQKMGIVADAQPIRLPANLLLEFGAVLQLLMWELDGFTAHLDAGLPSYTDAFVELARKTEQNDWDSKTIATDGLSSEVFKLSLKEFSWDAPSLLGIEVQLKTDNEDKFVEQLAEFLWRNRNSTKSERLKEGNANGS